MFQSPSLRGSGRFLVDALRSGSRSISFNPLHCGAVVASHVARAGPASVMEFQSPSLRGSGRFRGAPGGAAGPPAAFQSPSLRGSGRFRRQRRRTVRSTACFNPLHCGAVVASAGGEDRTMEEKLVSIPFIAGQWSLRCRAGGCESPARWVSIPFIAGQWSLRRVP